MARVGMGPHLRRVRELVGHELLVLPSVAVLPWDIDGRLLLVCAIDSGQWQTIGGAIEPDESPQQAGVREAREEASITVELTRLRGVIGGPMFRLVYPNGDQVAYVSTVFDAVVVDGVIAPDGDETSAVSWWSCHELGDLDVTPFTRALLQAVDVVQH
jgi:8-oxo-dGTP pyrophosphatase MutT (NUDIX family)